MIYNFFFDITLDAYRGNTTLKKDMPQSLQELKTFKLCNIWKKKIYSKKFYNLLKTYEQLL